MALSGCYCWFGSWPGGASDCSVYLHDTGLVVRMAAYPHSQTFDLCEPTSIERASTLIEHALQCSVFLRLQRHNAGWSWDEVISTPYRCRRRSLGIVQPRPVRNRN